MEQFDPMPGDWTRALAVAAHPDDLEYGAAGAIARWTAEGKDVRYLLVTRGEAGIDGMSPTVCGPLREAEQRASAAKVGVSVVDFLDRHDGVIEYGLALRRDIAAAIRKHQPELVILTNYHDKWPGGGGWNSPDHRNTGRAVLDAIGDAGNRWIFSGEGGEPWGGVRYAAVAGSPLSDHAIGIESTMDLAIASLQEHKAYLEGLGDHPMADAAGFLGFLADMTAPRFGGEKAAAFELIRLG